MLRCIKIHTFVIFTIDVCKNLEHVFEVAFALKTNLLE
jgi:hypothetical protein